METNLNSIKGLLVDFDGTLVDFKRSQLNAFSELFLSKNIEKTKIDSIFKEFLEIDGRLWRKFEKGEIDIDGVQETRFKVLSENFPDIIGQPWDINRQYQLHLINQTILIDYVQESLENLQKNAYPMVIISNGIDWVQKERVKKLDIGKFFKGLLTSEAVGYSKPHPAMFKKGLEILNLEPQEVIIVGDNPNADIVGGQQAGLQTCYIKNSNFQSDVKANIVANSFKDFTDLLLNHQVIQ